jgi:hypothetical protein
VTNTYPHSENPVIEENRLFLITGRTHKGDRFSFLFLGTSIIAVYRHAIKAQSEITPDAIIIEIKTTDITPNIVGQSQEESKLIVSLHQDRLGIVRS